MPEPRREPRREKDERDLAREQAREPKDPIGKRRTGTGTVRWWREDRGFGVLDVKAVAPWDVWCHFSVIDFPGFRTLKPGQTVEVDYVRADHQSFKYRAETVRLVGDDVPFKDSRPGRRRRR